MLPDRKTFEPMEADLDFFSIEVGSVPVWEQVRFSVVRAIATQRGYGQAHTGIDSDLCGYLRGVGLWLRNAIYRNRYYDGEHDILFFGHSRRKLGNDGYWWDIYCDPIHEQGDLNDVHFESQYLLSHKTPAKTDNLRYLELIQFTGTLQQKLGLRKPNIPEEIIDQLREAEMAIHE